MPREVRAATVEATRLEELERSVTGTPAADSASRAGITPG
jgi:hypothetical protein